MKHLLPTKKTSIDKNISGRGGKEQKNGKGNGKRKRKEEKAPISKRRKVSKIVN